MLWCMIIPRTIQHVWYDTGTMITFYFICILYFIVSSLTVLSCINTLRLRQNWCHFADNIFKCILFLMKISEWISLKISLKFVPKILINNIPALVKIEAWCWPGDKPSSEPITQPQWVNVPLQVRTNTFHVNKIIITACIIALEHADIKTWNVSCITGVGVTKAQFVNFSIHKIFDLAKAPFRLFESHLYLAGATTADLRQHLSNTNVIFNN